jgi:hypothetical protein
MQTSNDKPADKQVGEAAPGSAGKSPKRVVAGMRAVLVTLLVVVAVDVLVSYALVPYVGIAELMWREYRAAEAETLDTVLVGSSVTAYGISPMKLDEALGSSSFDMGTPGQSLKDSLTAIRTAVEEHGVTRAILGIGYETLIEEPSINSSVSFTLGKCIGETPLQAAGDWASLLTYPSFFDSTYSLGALFPFAYDHVELTPSSIADNLDRRLNMSVMDAAYAYSEASGGEMWHYRGQGHSSYELYYPWFSTHGAHHSSHPRGTKVVDVNIQAIDDLSAWCEGHGVTLYVFSAPYMPTAFVEYGDEWVDGMCRVRDAVEAHGGRFLEFNLIRRQRLDLLPTHFVNAVHINHDGAQLLGTFLGNTIKDVEKGADVSDWFYPLTRDGWRECLETAAFVDTIDYEEELQDDHVLITAKPVTGDTKVRYRFRMKAADGDTYEDMVAAAVTEGWETLRDYSPDPTYALPYDDGSELVAIEIDAYAEGEHEDIVRTIVGPVRV